MNKIFKRKKKGKHFNNSKIILTFVLIKTFKMMNMKEFNIEVELSNDEINFIKNIDWNSKSPYCEYSNTKYIEPLEQKGILVN